MALAPSPASFLSSSPLWVDGESWPSPSIKDVEMIAAAISLVQKNKINRERGRWREEKRGGEVYSLIGWDLVDPRFY